MRTTAGELSIMWPPSTPRSEAIRPAFVIRVDVVRRPGQLQLGPALDGAQGEVEIGAPRGARSA